MKYSEKFLLLQLTNIQSDLTERGHIMNPKKSGDFKKAAHTALNDCWCECVCIFLVVLGGAIAIALAALLVIQFLYTYGIIENSIMTIFSSGGVKFYCIIAIALLIICILAIPLKYGISWYYIQALDSRHVPASCFFSCYTNKKQHIRTTLTGLAVMGLRLAVALPVALCIIFTVRLAISAVNSSSGATFMITFVCCCLVLLIACLLFGYMIYSMHFTLVPYIYAMNPEKSVKDIISDSFKIIRRREFDLMEVLFSFTGWLALSLLIFPIIYVAPYMSMTFAAASVKLIKDHCDENDSSENTSAKPEIYGKAAEAEDNVLV